MKLTRNSIIPHRGSLCSHKPPNTKVVDSTSWLGRPPTSIKVFVILFCLKCLDVILWWNYHQKMLNCVNKKIQVDRNSDKLWNCDRHQENIPTLPAAWTVCTGMRQVGSMDSRWWCQILSTAASAKLEARFFRFSAEQFPAVPGSDRRGFRLSAVA